MKTIAFFLAFMMSTAVFAQSLPTYKKVNATTVKVTWYYENGNVKETGYFMNNSKDGEWISYNENGVKTSEANYTNGVKNGNWSIWNDQGVLTYHMVYENGKRVIATQWSDNGELIAGKQDK